MNRVHQDLREYRSGRLTAKRYLGQVDVGSQRVGKWECLCDCGKTVAVRTGSLTRLIPTQSCGCLQREVASNLSHNSKNKPKKDLTGMRIGQLTVVEFAGVCPRSAALNTRRLMWKCICDCGNTSVVRGSSLTCPTPTRSCGCLLAKYRADSKKIVRKPIQVKKVERVATRIDSTASCLPEVPLVMAKTRVSVAVADLELTDWLRSEYQGMKRRCEDDNHPYYHLFGGSGIELRWDNFEAFEEWILEELGVRPAGTKLIRIDRYGHFEIGNLRWAKHQIGQLKTN